MQNFKTKIAAYGDKEYSFECYENTEPINMGDKFIFFFGGIADVQECNTESQLEEINPNDRPKKKNALDLVHGFWRNCYKIKSTDFDLNNAY